MDRKDIEKIAALAHLELSEAEVASHIKKFNEVLGYIDQLKSVDTKKVKLTETSHAMATPMRDDSLKASLPVEQALRNAPESFTDFFLVPKVVES